MKQRKLRHMNIENIHMTSVYIKALTEITLMLCCNEYSDEEICMVTKRILVESLRYGVYADRSKRKGVLLKTRNPIKKLERVKSIVWQDKDSSTIVAEMKKALRVEIDSLVVEESYLI